MEAGGCGYFSGCKTCKLLILWPVETAGCGFNNKLVLGKGDSILFTFCSFSTGFAQAHGINPLKRPSRLGTISLRWGNFVFVSLQPTGGMGPLRHLYVAPSLDCCGNCLSRFTYWVRTQGSPERRASLGRPRRARLRPGRTAIPVSFQIRSAGRNEDASVFR